MARKRNQSADMLGALHKILETFAAHGYGEEALADTVSEGLWTVADAVGIDKVGIYRMFGEGGEAELRQWYRWGRAEGGMTPIDEKMRIVPKDVATARWMSAMMGDECVSVTVSEMRPEEERYVSPFGVKAMALVPIFVRKKLWGVVAFHDLAKERRFDEDVMDFLRSAARICVNLAIREEKARLADQAIGAYKRESEKSLNTLKNILNGMDALIGVTVPETGELLFISDRMREEFEVEGDGIGQFCYKAVQKREERCEFCPYHQLKKEPGKVVRWRQPTRGKW